MPSKSPRHGPRTPAQPQLTPQMGPLRAIPPFAPRRRHEPDNRPVARNRSPLYPRKQTFSWPSLTSGCDPGCVRTIFWELWRKIDSRSNRLTHETFTTPVLSILLLRAGSCFQSFDTAWTHSGPQASMGCAVSDCTVTVSLDCQASLSVCHASYSCLQSKARIRPPS